MLAAVSRPCVHTLRRLLLQHAGIAQTCLMQALYFAALVHRFASTLSLAVVQDAVPDAPRPHTHTLSNSLSNSLGKISTDILSYSL